MGLVDATCKTPEAHCARVRYNVAQRQKLKVRLRTPISRVKWESVRFECWMFDVFQGFQEKIEGEDSLASTPRLTAPSRSLTFGQRYGVVNEIV